MAGSLEKRSLGREERRVLAGRRRPGKNAAARAMNGEKKKQEKAAGLGHRRHKWSNQASQYTTGPSKRGDEASAASKQASSDSSSTEAIDPPLSGAVASAALAVRRHFAAFLGALYSR